MQAKKERIKHSSNPFVLAAMAELAAHGGASAKRASLPGSAKGLTGDNSIEGADVSSDDDDSGDDLDDFIVCKPGATTTPSLHGSSSTAVQSPSPCSENVSRMQAC